MWNKVLFTTLSTLIVLGEASKGGLRRTEECSSMPSVICSQEELSTFCEMIQTAGYSDSLGDGTHTVFAPTNEAIEKLGAGVVRALLNDVPTLMDIVAFHVVPDQSVPFSHLMCTKKLKMATGKDTRTVCRDGIRYQKGAGNTDEERPEIVAYDMMSCNGYVHEVDEVMLFRPLDIEVPPTASPTMSPSSSPTGGPTSGPTSAPTSGPTSGPTAGPTLAPTMGPTSGPTMMPTVVATEASTSEDIETMEPTFNDTMIPTENSTMFPDSNYTLEPMYNDTWAPTDNFTMYPDDNSTMAPTYNDTMVPTMNGTEYSNCTTLIESLCSDPDLAMVCSLMEVTGLGDKVSSDSNFTFFAPKNVAWGNIDSELYAIWTNDTTALMDVLWFHTLRGVELAESDLTCDETYMMGDGEYSQTFCGTEGGLYQFGAGNDSDNVPQLVVSDISVCDGVVHILDGVMLP
eukprot:Nitzschia sp. Nitz4//scaffold201_size42423//37153//38679//NITZ4_007380-RA/size42423-snap-gene-0.38-mRNA-1//1//CDS//3329541350//8949//frame0